MQKNKHAGTNQLRIIGGMYRSRKLTFPSIPDLRPTGDRIRETLFNWLAPHIIGSRCMDLFAGSGALGMEALSRGASQVTFIDASSIACESIRSNLNLLDPQLITNGKACVICANSLQWLTEESNHQFDIVFLDPPFSANLITACSEKLEHSGKLAPDCIIYTEQSTQLEPTANKSPTTPASWLSIKSKRAGSVDYQLFNRK